MADAVESLNALAKEVFGNEGPKDLIPNQNKLQQHISFKEKEAYGLKYVETIRLAYPGGFSHAKADGTAGAFALADSTAGVRARIEVTGEQAVLKDVFSFEDGARIAKGGKRAFAAFTSEIFEPMQRSMRKRLETQLLYGGANLGVIETYTGGDPSIVISAATWAEGIWVGLEGTVIEIHNGSTGASRGEAAIVSVDFDNRKITLSTTVASTDAADYVHWKDARNAEMSGVDKILTNSSTLFNVNAGTYKLWKGTELAAGSSPLSFELVKKAARKSYNLGLDDDLIVMCSAEGYDDMLTDLSALRRTDRGDMKKLEIGAEEICFYLPNGKVQIVPSNFVKKGRAYGLCKKDWVRLGAADVTFKTPGMEDEKLFYHLQSSAGIGIQSYYNQGIFCRRPAASFIITGIVNR